MLVCLVGECARAAQHLTQLVGGDNLRIEIIELS